MATTTLPRAFPRRIPPTRRACPSLAQPTTPSRRSIATSPAATVPPPQAFVPESLQVPPATTSRKESLRKAKPFSEFLTDSFARQHDYLRISLTERCNLRCTYCMPEEGVQLSPDRDILTAPEIYYLSALFVNQGVNKIRLTGGEPTVRKDIVPLMQQIGSLRRNGLKELALTTNGISLHRKLDDMVDAGLTGVNISLDTLDPFQFPLLTRRNGFNAVMKSINRVQEMNKLGAGVKLKINCVAMRGVNDNQIIPFVEMTRHQDVEIRFIEYMPFGGNKWSERKMLPYAELVDIIRAEYPTLTRLEDTKNDTSKTWQVPGFEGRVGFITSMTHNFCGTCNRLRITSDGNLKVCLHGNSEVSLRDLLRQENQGEPMDEAAFEAMRQIELGRQERQRANDAYHGGESWMSKERQLLEVIGAAVQRKKAGHAGMGELKNMKNRPMILIDELRHSEVPSVPFHIPNVASKFGQSAGLRIPPHLLQSTTARTATRQVRHYSTGPHSDSDRETEPDQSEVESRQSQLANTLGFQSLSELFSQPIRGRYSRARERAPLTECPNQPPPSSTNQEAPEGDQTQPEPLDPIMTTSKKLETSEVEGTEPKILRTSSRAKAPESESTESGFADNETGSRPTTRFPGDAAPIRRVHRRSARQSLGPKRHVLVEISSAFRRQFDANEKKPSSSAVEHGTRQRTGIVRYSGPRKPGFPSLRRLTGRPQVRPHPWADGPMQEMVSGQQHSDVASSVIKDQPRSRSLAAVQTRDQLSDTTAESSESEVVDSNLPAASHQAATTPTPGQPLKADSPGLTHKHTSNSSNNSKGLAHKHTSNSSMVSSSTAVLTHLSSTGEAHMVDVGEKQVTRRVAIARTRVCFSNEEPVRLILENGNKKGDVLGVARVAGIMAAKRTSDLIPLCHPIAINNVILDLEVLRGDSVTVEARVECRGQTGVEMEALTAATVAALTIYDMCKAVDKEIFLGRTRVVYKSGGKGGVFEVRSISKSRGRQWFIDRGLELPPVLLETPIEGSPSISQTSKVDDSKDSQQATHIVESNDLLRDAQQTTQVAEPDDKSQSTPVIRRSFSTRPNGHKMAQSGIAINGERRVNS